MAEKDGGLGLNLSLSLRCPEDLPPLPPPLSLVPSFMHQPHQEKSSLCDAFRISSGLELIADCSVEMGLRMRGIDVNRPVTVAECGEEMVVSSPNSTVSSVSGKMCEREENETERASDSLEDDGGEAARKKLRLSKDQSAMLEEIFKEHNTLTPKQKVALAKQLNLRPRQVEVWFQNRRARTKLKQTEVDCEYLRRCCENLTEENRRLKKEVNELRALKLTPQFYMNMNPPTTLTMCPSCERVAVSSSSSSAAASSAMATTSAGTARNHNNVPLDQQRPIPTTPCAAVFSSQPYDVHHPRP